MKNIVVLFFLLMALPVLGQKSFNEYHQVYPISLDDPNVRYMTSYTKQETILFEANPIARYSIYNNFIKKLSDDKQRHTQAWYIAFRPQLRMYSDNSKPVRMPSYRILLGSQHMYRIHSENKQHPKFWGFSVESGHYSNGQDRSAFSEDFADGSPESQDIYNSITNSTDLSDILNRKSGNFSTNLTEVLLNYRTYQLDDDFKPREMHSFTFGYVLYHNNFLGVANFGGYTPEDIALYGHHHFQATYEFMQALSWKPETRYTVKQFIEWIETPHPSVNKLRMETMITYYPFPHSRELGFLASYIYGHDNYNFRFVDSGHQITLGLTWSLFPPVALRSDLE